MTENKSSMHRRLEGVVVSDKMSKTRVVAITLSKFHPKYKEHYHITSRIKAHDEKNSYKMGDVVVIEETRPISRHKRFRIVEKIGSVSVQKNIEE